MSADRVLGELTRLSFPNMSDYIAIQNGKKRFDFSRVRRDDATAICSLHITKYGGVRLKLAAKRGALELLGKYQKLFARPHRA